MRYKDGKIEHDLHELLEGCSEDTKMEMIESMACDADIIKHVTAQILDHRQARTHKSPLAVGRSDTQPRQSHDL